MTLYAERKPSRHRPFAIIETRGSGFLIVLVVHPMIQCYNDTIMVPRCPISDGCMIVDGKGLSCHREGSRRLACHGRIRG